MKKIYGLLSLCLVVLMGCSSESKEDTIVVSGYATDVAIPEMLDKYEQEVNPGVDFVWEPVTDDYWVPLKTRTAAGDMPDITYMNATNLPEFASAGRLLPLDEYITQDVEQSYIEGVYKSYNYDSKQYGIPKDYNTLSLYYNEGMLKQAGVEIPEEGYTFNTFYDALVKVDSTLEEGSSALTVTNELQRFRVLPLLMGSDLIVDGELNLTDPIVAEAFDLWFKLYDEGLAVSPTDLGYTNPNEAFFNGKSAFMIDGSWSINAIDDATKDTDFKYSTIELPTYKDNDKNTLIFSMSYAISAQTKYPKEAADFIMWYTLPENRAYAREIQESAANNGGGIPTLKDEADAFVKENPIYEPFKEGGEYGTSESMGTTYDSVITKNLGSLLENRVYDESLNTVEELKKVEDSTKLEVGQDD